MTSYSNIFGGPNVQPATISYAAYGTIAVPQNVNVQLNWATSYVDNNTPVAQIMDFYTTVNGIVMTFPDATQNSVGQVCQINNQSAHTLTVNKFDNTLLVSIPTGTSFELYLTNNTTSAGAWNTIQSGAVNSAPNAAALAGNGLVAIGSTLNTNVPPFLISATYTVLPTDRSKIFVWTGGVGTLYLPAMAGISTGFDVSVNNSGGGVLSVSTTDGAVFDNLGVSTFNLNPGQSSSFIASRLAGPGLWNSLGFGTETFSSVNALGALNISGGTPVNLTQQQAAYQILEFTGNLGVDTLVTFPGGTGVWYIYNFTTGVHTVKVGLFAGGNQPLVPQGEKIIVYSDGTNMYNVPTIATSTVFSDGSVGSPSIGFGSDTTSGFYKAAPGQMSYSSQGTQILSLVQGGLDLWSQNGVYFYDNTNMFWTSLQSGNTGANLEFLLPTADATVSGQVMYSNAAGQLNFTTTSFPTSTTINQLLYSSAANTVTGLATANNGVLVTSAGGVPSISSTLPTAVQGNITSLGTIASGVWNGTPLTVSYGGTGLNTLTTAYGVVCAGTTATGALQNAGVGTANQVFTSNGAGALPSWKAITVSLPAATAADERAAASTTVYTNPGVQKYHPSSVKAWIKYTFFGGAPGPLVIYGSYNMNNPTWIGVGTHRLTMTNAMLDTGYCVHITTGSTISTQQIQLSGGVLSTTQFDIQLYSTVPFAAYDTPWVMVTVTGNM